MNRLFSFSLTLLLAASFGFYGCAAPATDDGTAAAEEAPAAEEKAAEAPAEEAVAEKPAEEPKKAEPVAEPVAEEKKADVLDEAVAADAPEEEAADDDGPKDPISALFGALFGGGQKDADKEEKDEDRDLLAEAAEEDEPIVTEDEFATSDTLAEEPEEPESSGGFFNIFGSSNKDVTEQEADETIVVEEPVEQAGPFDWLFGGSDVSTNSVLGNMTPRLDNMSQTHDEARITFSHVIDTNGRQFWNDFRMFLLMERPSRLTRYPVAIFSR
jgi:hypothetical protein